MKRVAAKFHKKAVALTNPNPSFVSLVRAGANMTPFLAVKSAEGTNAQEANMRTKKQKSETHDIAGITFRVATFKTEEAVQAWLTAGGYEDTVITTKDDGDFYVAGVEGLSDVKSVEADGIVIMTGKRDAAPVVTEKTEEDKAKEAEAASGIVTITQKTDEVETLLGSSVLPANVEIGAKKSVQLGDVVALAHKTSGLSIADWNALKDEDREAKLVEAVEALKTEEAALVAAASATEVVPPVAGATVAPTLEETVSKAVAMLTALGETGIQFEAKKGVYTVSEIGYVMNSLRWLVDDADWNGLSDASITAVKSAAGALLTVMVEAMQNTVDSYVEAFKAEAATKAEQEAKAKADAPATPDPLAALMLRMETMEATVNSLTTENTTLKSEKTVAEERVKSLEEDQRQTRKSADAAEAAAANPTTETPATKTESTDSEFVAERRKRSILGI